MWYLEEDYRSNFEKIEETKEHIKYLKSKNIFNDLTELETKAEKFIDKEFNLANEIKFLHTKLCKFNKLDKKDKSKYLDHFCTLILNKENDFTNSLDNYNSLHTLNLQLDKYKKTSKLDLKFNLWNEIEIDLLAVYDAELYLHLEELYTKLKTIEVYINRIETLEEVQEIINEKLEPVISKNKDHLKSILLKTNKLFKHI